MDCTVDFTAPNTPPKRKFDMLANSHDPEFQTFWYEQKSWNNRHFIIASSMASIHRTIKHMSTSNNHMQINTRSILYCMAIPTSLPTQPFLPMLRQGTKGATQASRQQRTMAWRKHSNYLRSPLIHVTSIIRQ